MSRMFKTQRRTIINNPNRKITTTTLLYAIILFQNPISNNSFVVSKNGSSKLNANHYHYNHRSFKGALFGTKAKEITTNKNFPFNANTNNPPKSMTKITNDSIITDKLVVVQRKKQSLEFKNGSPLVFSGAIAYTVDTNDKEPLSNNLPMCSLVTVAVSREDNNNVKKTSKTKPTAYPHYTVSDINNDTNLNLKSLQIIGYGVYNPNSMYRVRILCHESINTKLCTKLQKESINTAESNKERYLMECIVRGKIKTAIALRKYLNLPNDQTDTFRLVNSEGDGLSGLCVDVLGGNVVVVMSSAAWCEYYKDSIVSVLKDEVGKVLIGNEDIEVIWRCTNSRLEQDGYYDYLSSDDADSSTLVPSDKKDASIILKENNVSYKVYPYSDNVQKTGFYCDQRINRQTIASLCADKDVLDLCCFNGSFSLNAALANAKSTIGVDSSADAISSADANAILNSLQNVCSFVQADVEDYMKQCIEEQKYFDVIVLDPPKLAPTLSSLTKATRKYKQLNKFALQLIHPTNGGLLVSCTCSSAMSQKDGGEYFIQMIHEASLTAKKDITLLSVYGASPCHTQNVAGFPKSGKYLTVALFHVAPFS